MGASRSSGMSWGREREGVTNMRVLPLGKPKPVSYLKRTSSSPTSQHLHTLVRETESGVINVDVGGGRGKGREPGPD